MAGEFYHDQLIFYGKETMTNVCKMKVLLVGVGSLGVEIAQSLLLTGPRTLTIHDDHLVSDIGQKRSSAVLEKLNSLNPFATVNSISGSISCELLLKYHLVIFTQGNFDSWILYNEFCRAQTPSIGFICAKVFGLAAYFFSDFGPTHIMTEPPTQTFAIESIMMDSGQVNGHFPFQNGDYVCFPDLDLNTAYPITDCDPTGFTLDHDVSGFTPKRVVLAKKRPELHHKSLRECLISPDACLSEREREMHAIFNGFHTFEQQFGHLPVPGQLEEVESLMKSKTNALKAVLNHLTTDFIPINMILGGVIAHEAIKLIGIDQPLKRQLWYLDAIDLFAQEVEKPSRIAILGSGKTGKELAKAFTLLGVPCTIIDGAAGKSQALCTEVKAMRKDIDTRYIASYVNPDTEALFSDTFWRQIDIIVSAVQDQDAQEYIDEQCRYFEKPRIVCNQLGNNGIVHVAVPHVSSIDQTVSESNTEGGLPSLAPILAGFACIEAFKIQQNASRGLLRNTAFNTSSMVFTQTMPEPPFQRKSLKLNPLTGDSVRVLPENFTSWDNIRLEKAKTLSEVIETIETMFEVRVVTVESRNLCLYSASKSSHAVRLKLNLIDVLNLAGAKKRKKIQVTREFICLNVSCQDEGDVIIPPVLVRCIGFEL